MPAFVYLLTNQKNGTLYLGSTGKSLAQRLTEHRSGQGSEFTAKWHLYQLVWFQEFPDIISAREQEFRMKTWKRAWKIAAIEKLNPQWQDLSALL